ncbi:uncharacterized protein LOC103573065 isoform X2 [Microplitis demolitor]|uniref:uncharacterized protein LOC103573065 isoform X2 n=1 Tax=Microplitis demolitor TaxID=69319 RepID=UPI00235B6E4D|nr:uncharacterized protein LOC103573065 isoform X2 [Microplitis demolitor]
MEFLKIKFETRKWYPDQNEKMSPTLPSSPQKLVSPLVTRRVTVLNKLFMKYVTDIMTTGEVSADVAGLGIEISRVKLSNDFKLVRVMWFSSNTKNLDQISDILHQTAFKLRHELSQLKIIGVVPPIIFVKDKQSASLASLEKTFETADYGEDYVPTVRIPPKPELCLFTRLPQEVREQIKSSDSSNNITVEDDNDYIDETDDGEIYNVNLPPMRQDVLGLNRGLIMTQIKQSLYKSKEALKNRLDNVSINTSQTLKMFDPSSINALRTEEENQAFDDFLLKRQIEAKRQRKYEMQNLYEDNLDTQEKIEDELDDYDEEFDFDQFNDINEKDLQ